MLALGLLTLRVILGGFVAAHGVQKSTHLWGGGGLEASSKEFRDDGFVGGKLTALAAGGTQLVGGALLIFGLLTPLAAAAVIGTMVVATTVKLRVGFWSQDGGFEYPLFLSLLGIAVAWTGPGDFSLDGVLGLDALYAHRCAAWVVSVIATVAGIACGLATRMLLTRPAPVTPPGKTN
ncbi:DoxX family protein [Streptomyces puniciscabiei]